MVSTSKADANFGSLRESFFGSVCEQAELQKELFGRACSSVQNGLLEQGISTGIIHIENLLSLLEQESTAPFSTVSQETDLVEQLMTTLVVQECLHSFTDLYKSKIEAYFRGILNKSILINLILLFILLVVFVGGWLAVFNKFQRRVLMSKNVLSLLPVLMLKQNVRVNKYIQEVIQTINAKK